MKIIVLDDSPEEIFAFHEFLGEYYPQSEVCLTNNLMDFHEFLFESGKRDVPFKKMIIDAYLEMPNDMDLDQYKAFLKRVSIDYESVADSDLLGWLYFDRYLRKTLPPERLPDVLIKTGFSGTVRALTSKAEGDVKILNKGDPDFYKQLKDFLSK